MLRYGFLLIVFLRSIAFAQVTPPQPLTASSTVAAAAASTETYSITITVKNIRNKNGVIRFKFYDDSTPFPHDFGFLKEVVPKTEVTGDSLRVTFHGFKSQHMAIALLDDENNNVKLDFGWFLPKEGHAFSDYYHSALRRPVYEDFAFTLTGDKNVVMIMRYY
jgi:uncharacterized protein (DUF2141 family)